MNILVKMEEYLLNESFEQAEERFVANGVDRDEAKEVIKKFKINRNKVSGTDKDIFHWTKMGFDKFKEFVDGLEKVKTKREEIRIDPERNKNKGDVVDVFANNNVRIIIPKTEGASCLYGQGTKWCTAGEVDNHFKDYLHGKGHTLYYLIFKGGIDESFMRNDKFVTKYHGNGDKGIQHGNKHTVEEILDEQKQIRDLYMKAPKTEYNRLAVLVRNPTPEQIAQAEAYRKAKAKGIDTGGKMPARLVQAFDIYDNFMKSNWFDKIMEHYKIPNDTFILRTEKKNDTYNLKEAKLAEYLSKWNK